MSDNLTNKILRRHLVSGELIPGQAITVSPNQILIEDATGTMAAMQFEQLGADAVQVPLAVMYIDHNVLQIDDKNMQDHQYLRTFCERYGLRYSPAGHGISHYIHLERFAKPGELLLGADSHTSTAGAAGMFALGAGGLEVAVAMGGYGFEFACPRVIGVELVGTLADAVEPKDVVLEILRRYGVRGGRGAVFEFHGEGIERISTTGRATIANMIIETGATTAVFPSDDQTLRWLREQGRAKDFEPLIADATYDENIRIDLSKLIPLVAVPHSPGNVLRVAELPRTPISQVCVGSSVNSSYHDLATVAAALRGRTVHPQVQMTVTPGSRQILSTIATSGVYQDLMSAGARMLEPICGPCVGIGLAPLQAAASLRTLSELPRPQRHRRRPGLPVQPVHHSGERTDRIHHRSHRPSTDQDNPRRSARHSHPRCPHHHATARIRARTAVVVQRGPNLVSPPVPEPVPDLLDAKVLINVGDDISTGDMAPDGAIAMSVWSNIALCARFMFNRLDTGFHDRAKKWGGGIIVAGDNYGQGSSREHAAIIPVYLGIRVIAAKSYARIHRRNLIAAGIVPLVLPAETPARDVGEQWTITGLRQALIDGALTLTAQIAGQEPITLSLDGLSAGERDVLAAGGLLSYIRQGGRPRVASHRPLTLA